MTKHSNFLFITTMLFTITVGILVVAFAITGCGEPPNGGSGEGNGGISSNGPDPKEDESPIQIEEDAFLQYYPAGKTIVSIANIRMDGVGENRLWIIKSSCQFVYRNQLHTRSTVLKNDGKTATFEIEILAATKTRIVSERKIKISGVSSYLSAARKVLGLGLTLKFPQFSPVTWTLENVFRPKKNQDDGIEIDGVANELLTYLTEQMGIQIDPSEIGKFGIDFMDQKLNGAIFEVDYSRKTGIIDWRAKNSTAREIGADQFKRLAQQCASLIDYWFSKVQDVAVGKNFKINAREVERVVLLEDVALAGEIVFKRLENAKGDEGKGEIFKIFLSDGNVRVTTDQGVAYAKPLSGVASFDPEGKYLERIDIEWEGELSWLPKSHLLFGTATREVSVETTYQAERE